MAVPDTPPADPPGYRADYCDECDAATPHRRDTGECKWCREGAPGVEFEIVVVPEDGDIGSKVLDVLADRYHVDSLCGSCQGLLDCHRDAICDRCVMEMQLDDMRELVNDALESEARRQDRNARLETFERDVVDFVLGGIRRGRDFFGRFKP